MEPQVKQEITEPLQNPKHHTHQSFSPLPSENVIELSDSDDDYASKKQKVNGELYSSLSSDHLESTPPLPDCSLLFTPPPLPTSAALCGGASKQFWKAGDFDGGVPSGGDRDTHTGGMDHVRVHPKFLHSNATSHKWALGAFAELLDNALDEVCNGATYVNVDMLINKKDGSNMLLIEDNGGGMDPDKMRQCMSLGYSAKSKIANTIGQYGNGFKTSTMRLGADVIVFSRSCGKDGKSVSQSIGLLSYTFLRSTGKEDIVVPILDYEKKQREWVKIIRSSADDLDKNVGTIVSWSPYSSEAELLQQFNLMKDHGTRIIIYNLWEDDQGQLELDFNYDRHDIQIRGVNRDEKNVQMAKEYPNSRHFLTYRHSLRSYASILYLRLPPNFRIILRGKDVENHNLVNDMMMNEEVTYRPQPGSDGVPRDQNMVAIVTIGFVKDATAHIDVQGFNVYHKNRLIKPFWRVWNAAGSDGRGVIGMLEANFVEPAHDKQGFERTTVLARLENKLVQMQKTYWRTHCHKIGYAPRRIEKQIESKVKEPSSEYTPPSLARKRGNTMDDRKYCSNLSRKQGEKNAEKYASMNEKYDNGHAYHTRGRKHVQESSSSSEDTSVSEGKNNRNRGRSNGDRHPVCKASIKGSSGNVCSSQKATNGTQQGKGVDRDVDSNISDLEVLVLLKEENRQLEERLAREEKDILGDLPYDLQLVRDRRISLEMKIQEALRKIEELNKDQESLIDIFSEERDRRDIEEENLRKRLRDASNTIEELRERVKILEQMKTPNGKR